MMDYSAASISNLRLSGIGPTLGTSWMNENKHSLSRPKHGSIHTVNKTEQEPAPKRKNPKNDPLFSGFKNIKVDNTYLPIASTNRLVISSKEPTPSMALNLFCAL